MSLLIPAIEINPLAFVGDVSSGSATISNISDTSPLLAGMVVYGTGIEYRAEIVSKTSSTITLSKLATATNAGLSLTAYSRFDFEYPPKEDDGEQVSANQAQTDALSGIRQTVTNYLEYKRRLTFDFLTKTEIDKLLSSYLKNWIILGREFRYFNDKEVNDPITYVNDIARLPTVRTIKKHPDFLYELQLGFRRHE